MYTTTINLNTLISSTLKPLSLAVFSAVVLTACGGGGGGGSSSTTTTTSNVYQPSTPATNIASTVNGGSVDSTGGRNAEAVIDGDGSVITGWQPDASGDQLTLVLDQSYSVDTIQLFQRGLGNSNRYTVEISEDNINFTPISLLLSGDCGGLQFSGVLMRCNFLSPRQMQYLRFTINAEPEQVEIFEVQILQGRQTLEQFVNNTFIIADRTYYAAAIDWSLPSDTSVKSYNIYQDGALVATLDAEIDGEGYVAYGLTEETEYVYQIGLVNNNDEEFLLSKLQTVATLSDQAVVPQAPSVLVYNRIVRDEIEIQWDNTTADNESGYRILRDGVEIDTSDFDQDTYIDAGLTPDTEYTYSVIAFNKAGDSTATSATFTTLQAVRTSLNPPINVAASATADSITVTFDAASDNPDGYMLVVDGISGQFICDGATITECTATGLQSNTSYDLNIRAIVYTRKERIGTTEVVWSSEETITETTLAE